MSLLIPGRRRGWATRDDRAPRSATPAVHVDLGRVARRRHSLLHILTPVGTGWVTVCARSPAYRSFPGRPNQSNCVACRQAVS